MCDVDTSAGLDFAEFVTAAMTYCFFGKLEILKFCFYIFDKDKNGFIEDDELLDLVAILHKDGVTSNIENTLNELDTDKDGRLAFSELQKLNTLYPTILYPAFKIQHTLQVKTLGAEFFYERKQEFQKSRNAEKVDQKEREREQLKRRDELRKAAVRREMGFWKYYFCYSQREAVLAKILPDIEPPAKKKKIVSKKMSSNKKRPTSSRKGRRKIKIRSKDDKYLEKSEKRREERRKSREAMGRTRISKRDKLSKKVLSESSKRDGNRTHIKLKRPSTRRRKNSRRRSSKKKKKKSMRGPTSRVMSGERKKT